MITLMNFDANVREIFENDESRLSAFKKLMMDTASGCLEEGISIKEANEKIVSMFKQIIGVGEGARKADVQRAIKDNEKTLFRLIEEVVPNLLRTGWQENPFFKEFVEVRNTDIGDKAIFTTDDETILSVSKVSGNHWDIDRQRLGKGSSFSVETSWYGLAVYSEYERLLTGAEDFATFVKKLYEAVDKFVNESIYQAVISASAQLPGGATGSGQWVKTGALTSAEKAVFMQLIEDVQMATGMDVVIMGTKTALSRLEGIQAIEWVSEDMKVQRNTTGRIGLNKCVM